MKADLASAYAASLARVASWAIMAGLIFRMHGDSAFAAFSFLRAVMSAVAVSGLGLAPALIILLPKLKASLAAAPVIPIEEPKVLNYVSARKPLPEGSEGQLMVAASQILVVIIFFMLMFGNGIIQHWITKYGHGGPFWTQVLEGFANFSVGTLMRISADAFGARLQTSGRLALDNFMQAATEIVWVTSVLFVANFTNERYIVFSASLAYCIVNSIFLAIRVILAFWKIGPIEEPHFNVPLITLLLGTGVVLMIAQIADLLYGPANQALIKAFLSTDDLAHYAPLLHIDAAMLLGVGGLSTLLLPKTAIAIGAGKPDTVRRYYINGTLASLTLLAAGAAVAWAFAPKLFTLWFNDPLPATAALLPLVMIHTVIGGSAGVGRAVLFGLNRAKAYTAAALIGGVANVGLAILLVTKTSLGLRAIVLATIITVAVRCGVWMPWFILKCLRAEDAKAAAHEVVLASAPAIP